MSLFHCLLHVKPIYEVRDFCEGFFKVFLIGDIHEVVVFFDFSRIVFFFPVGTYFFNGLFGGKNGS